jgi:carboxylesterase type B
VLPDTPDNLIASGNYNKAPLILGSNKRELGLIQLFGVLPTMNTVADLEQYIVGLCPGDAAAAKVVSAQYPAASDQEANDVYVRMMTDFTIRCPVRRLARTASEKGSKVLEFPQFSEHLKQGARISLCTAKEGVDLPKGLV